MPECFPPVPDLKSHLRELLMQAPSGRVVTCGALATALGNRIAATWVGYFMLHHDHDAACSCHRVIRAGGALGGYVAGTIDDKVRLLVAEGVTVRDGLVDLEAFGFERFCGARPLAALRQVQEEVQKRIRLCARRKMPKWVGGVDVAYPSAREARAAYALVETETARLIWSTTVRCPVAFPYISTYLSFREIPPLHALLERVRAAGRMAEVLLVDGSGVLHQRQAGIAAHLGVVEALPTIGVTKKLLCGEVDIADMAPYESRPVVYAHQPVGAAIRPTAGSHRPIFVSPGHRVDAAFAERLVRGLLRGRRLPEPIYWADRLSRSGAAAP